VLDADDLGGTKSIFKATPRQDTAPEKPERPAARTPRRKKQYQRSSPWPWIAAGGGAALVLLLLVVGLVIIISGGGKPESTVTREQRPDPTDRDSPPIDSGPGERINSGLIDPRGKQPEPPPEIENPAMQLTGHNGRTTAVAFHPNGKTLVSVGEDGRLLVWDWQKQHMLRPFSEPNAGIVDVIFCPDTRKINRNPEGYIIATAHRKGGHNRGRVLYWDPSSGKFENGPDHANDVMALVLSPDRQILASASADGSVNARDLRNKNLPLRLDRQAGSLTFSGDSRTLFAGGGDWDNKKARGVVKAWWLPTGTVLWEKGETFGGIWGLAVSGDGVLAGACADGTVRRWKAETGQELLAFRGHTDKLTAVAYSPSGRRLASSSLDGTVRLRDSQTGDLKATLKHPSSVWGLAFSPRLATAPAGKYLATGCEDGTVRIWDIEEYDRR
jgi:WD40 repeat protein